MSAAAGLALIVVLLPAAALFFLFHPVAPLRVRSLFPFPPRGRSWRSGTADGIPYLVEDDLPYGVCFTETDRETLCLDGRWQLLFGFGEGEGLPPEDAPWTETAVPSAYNAAEGGRTDYLGVVWYRREFDAAPRPGFAPLLRFEGVLLRGAVWLNGAFLGAFEGGFTPRLFAAASLRAGPNVLLVRTDNRLTPDSLPPRPLSRHNPGWHTYGGVYRSVRLEFLPPSYLVKASCAYDEAAAQLTVAALSAEGAAADGARSVAAELIFGGKPVASAALRAGSRADIALRAWTGSFAVPELRRWSPADPALYTVRLTLSGDSFSDRAGFRTGFRTFAAAGGGFRLNGSPIFLKGVCRHEDDPELGPAQTPDSIERDLALIAELGANYIRLAHYPHDPRELDAARDRGFLLSGEIPFYQAGAGFTAWFQEKRPLSEFPAALFGLRQTARPRLLENARRQLAEMIERDRNNPALVFWCVGNECYTLGRRSGELFRLLADTARFFDPTRPVTNVELTYRVPPLDRAERGWTGMDFCSLNSYFGWYYGTADELGPFLDALDARRGGRPLLLSEFGADAAFGRSDRDGPWKAERVGAGRTYSEAYQAELLRAYLDAAAERPYVAGASPWVFADFYNTWFPHNPVPNYNLKGLVSARRERKAGFYAVKERYRGKGI